MSEDAAARSADCPRFGLLHGRCRFLQRVNNPNKNKNKTPLRFFHSRGVPAPSKRGKIRLRLNAAHMNQLPLEDVVVLAQMRAPHASCVVAMRKAAFHQLAAPPQKARAVVALHPSPVGVHRLLLAGFALPVAAAPSAAVPECNCALDNSSPAPPPRRSDTPCRSPSLRCPQRSPLASHRAAARPRAPLTPPPLRRPRTASGPWLSYRPYRLPARSPPPPRQFHGRNPDLLRFS